MNVVRNTAAAALAAFALAVMPYAAAQPVPKDEHEGHHPEEQKKGPAAKPSAKAAPAQKQPDTKGSAPRGGPPAGAKGPGAMGMGMMDPQMKAMHQQMEKIQATQDPQERRRLMDEHMSSMQQGMAKMRGMMGGAAGGAKSPASPGMRMDGMERRMDMMQMMMEQMMGHQRALQETPR